jgi:hypothetical protein
MLRATAGALALWWKRRGGGCADDRPMPLAGHCALWPDGEALRTRES